MFLKKGFYLPVELSSFGVPLSERTLENRRRGGAIRFGSGQPDLPVTKIGGRVVIAARDLERWLAQMGGLPASADPVPVGTTATPAPAAPVRRPGRPRKALQGGGQ
jgi:hypothetical protein